MKTCKNTILAVAGLVAFCAIARLLPHPPNYTPVAAAALFAGAVIPGRWAALCVPLFGLALSDLFIGGYDYRAMVCVYAALAFPVFLRTWLQGRWPAARVLGCAALSSLSFFLVSNFAVWAFGSMFARTAAGLIECYAVALPFFQFTLMGDLCWSGMLFGGYAILANAAGWNGLHADRHQAVPAVQWQAT